MLLLKGGLKALISKLAVPLISLLLINVEILITVWWLWDDCLVLPEPINEPVKFRNAVNTTELS
ncbi:vitelline membrane associated protein P30 precursor [Danaus plexippus plexippus]|uniref:Vitelline membrane associated protein P30 n=1 Tax=Danaus plexippus plexippus TaxID=278856 RepID=A0A212FIS2_DANPL|nr:vitelline membrane associated protein P30 precursor [Danaus plexippus plexippus]